MNNNDDIANIPTSASDYQKCAQDLTEDELEFLMNPRDMNRLEQEYLALHNQLNHIEHQAFFRLCERGNYLKSFSLFNESHHLVLHVSLAK